MLGSRYCETLPTKDSCGRRIGDLVAVFLNFEGDGFDA